MSTINVSPQQTQALRHNQGKPKLTMVPSELTEEVARVLEFGARKYARDNWKKGLPWTETMDSCLRHIAKWNDGEDIDPESGCLHLAHAACNLAFLLHYAQHKPGFDDRSSTTQPFLLNQVIHKDIGNE